MKIASILVAGALCLASAAAYGQAGWFVVETPPINDRSVVIKATTVARGGTGGIERFSIICRGERIEMSVGGPGLTGQAQEYASSYRINDGTPVALGPGLPGFLEGVALPGDVRHLLQSLPETGDITIRLTRQGVAHDSTFALDGLKPVRDKVIGYCTRSR